MLPTLMSERWKINMQMEIITFCERNLELELNKFEIQTLKYAVKCIDNNEFIMYDTTMAIRARGYFNLILKLYYEKPLTDEDFKRIHKHFNRKVCDKIYEYYERKTNDKQRKN